LVAPRQPLGSTAGIALIAIRDRQRPSNTPQRGNLPVSVLLAELFPD
jgi:hypothetical protein